jgi:Ca2+-binding EF-hand superfamily protein
MAEFNRALVEADLAHKPTLNHDECILLAQHLWSEESHEIVLEKSLKRISKHGDFISKQEFSELMTTKGEQLSQRECDELLSLIGATQEEKINHAGEHIFKQKILNRL